MRSRKVRRDGKTAIAGALWTALLSWTLCGGGAADAAELVSAVASNPAGDAHERDLLARALQGPLSDAEEIVFAVRSMGSDGHWYANFGHRSTGFNDMNYGPDGGRLCRLNLRTGELDVLLDDPAGGVRDPQVHYDGRKILFSYRQGGSRYFHLYEIDIDGSDLRQLTDGPFDDIEPIYLPDGDICSARRAATASCSAGSPRWRSSTAATPTARTPPGFGQRRAGQHALDAARRTRALHALGIRRPQPRGSIITSGR